MTYTHRHNIYSAGVDGVCCASNFYIRICIFNGRVTRIYSHNMYSSINEIPLDSVFQVAANVFTSVTELFTIFFSFRLFLLCLSLFLSCTLFYVYSMQISLWAVRSKWNSKLIQIVAVCLFSPQRAKTFRIEFVEWSKRMAFCGWL